MKYKDKLILFLCISDLSVGTILVDCGMIKRISALEQSQKMIHGWIAVNGSLCFTNEPFIANNLQFHYWISHEDGKTNEHVEPVPANSN